MTTDNNGFQPFTAKNGRYVTQKTLSLTINQHGYLNIPGSIHTSIFNDAPYIEYYTNNTKLGLQPHTEDSAPQHAYTLSGDSPSVAAETVLVSMGKQPPESHTMLELKDADGLAYVEVSKLPDLDDDA